MKNKNKLTIYLIKEGIDNSIIIKEFNSSLGNLKKVILNEDEVLYFESSYQRKPSWVKTFFNDMDELKELFVASTKVILLKSVYVSEKKRTFAITMGFGKSLFADNVVEENFGLITVLNSIESDELRRLSKTNVGGNQKLSNEQLPMKSDIFEFGIDIERDILKSVTGRCENNDFHYGMMTGGDMLSLSAEVNIDGLSEFLLKCYNRYSLDTYKKNFGWIDNIKLVKDKGCIKELDQKVYLLIKDNSPTIWMAVPEVVEWENIKCFKYTSNVENDDIEIKEVIRSLKSGFTNIEQLKTKKIDVINSITEEVFITWKAYKCLVGEIQLEGNNYCINNGKWYIVNQDFKDSVNRKYESIELSKLKFIESNEKTKNEKDYNIKLAESDKDYILLDSKNVVYGGGHSSIELCDVLTKNMQFIHVKKYSGSATLSHLFNQGLNSAILVKHDKSFRDLANLKIKEATNEEKFRLKEDIKEIEVIFAIISKDGKERPEIPFFSKISLTHVNEQLIQRGCKLLIKAIRSKV